MVKIEGTKYNYVDEFGKVYSDYSGEIKEMTFNISKDGYKRVKLKVYGEDKTIKIHRLVGIAFILNPENLPQINHKDGNKLNNHVDNLEWCNNSYNQKHAWDNGLHTRIIPPNISLTREQAKEIRDKYKCGNTSQRKLAIEYNVSKTTIADLLNGKHYNHDKVEEKIVFNKNIPKLTMEQAKEIRLLFGTKEYSYNRLGKMFGVDHKTIKRIVDSLSYI